MCVNFVHAVNSANHYAMPPFVCNILKQYGVFFWSSFVAQILLPMGTSAFRSLEDLISTTLPNNYATHSHICAVSIENDWFNGHVKYERDDKWMFLAKVSTTSNINTVRSLWKRCLYCSENRIQHNLLAVTPNEELMDCIHQCIYIGTKILEFVIVVLSKIF